MGKKLTLPFALAAIAACGGLAVPDVAESNSGDALPAEATPLEGAEDGQETDDSQDTVARSAGPVRGAGPMIVCDGADCPSAGACGATFIDLDCDGAWKECAEGTHREHRAGDTCSTCVPDSAQRRTCQWARERYLGFLQELTTSSCADFCNSAADCSASLIENACMTDLVVSLYGMINEEITLAAESFSNENCAALCGSEPAPRAEQPSGAIACVNHRCTFAD